MLYPVELRALALELCNELPEPSRHARKPGRGRGIRTPDILLPTQARDQTALYPDAPWWPRRAARAARRDAQGRVRRRAV